jgi:hypothetical protein
MAADIKASLKKYLPHVLKAKEDNLSEADTSMRLVKIFEDVLGYDALSEITKEKQIKSKYVDIAIKINNVIKYLVEVKAADVALREKHIDQAISYAANSNIKWVLLSNGVEWNLYHLSFDEGIETELAFSVNLETDNIDKAVAFIGLLHRQSIMRGGLEEFWQQKVALNPGSIGRAIFTEDVIKYIRKEIKRKEGISIDIEDLGKAMHSMFSQEVREQIGPFKIKKKKKIKTLKVDAHETMVDIEDESDEKEEGKKIDTPDITPQ